MKNQFLDSIKDNLLYFDSIKDSEISFYKNFSYYENDKLLIELNFEEINEEINIYNNFIILFDNYNIFIYDYENFENDYKNEDYRFSINHIQFEDDKNNYKISYLIDEYFRLFISYLEYDYKE